MLEELLAPLKWVDEQLLGAYTWYAVKIEKETGMDKFDLAAKYNLKAKWLFMAHSGVSFGAEHPFSGFTSLVLSVVNLFEEKVLYNFLSERDTTQFLEGVRGIAQGYAWFSWSSAIYIRSSDPKLLDRESLWQKLT